MTRHSKYQTVAHLAQGGMGTVELAVRKEDRFLRVFALKRLKPDLRADAGARAMFMDEARVAGMIRHPNVVSVLDVGEDGHGPYLVMDYVQGVSLAQVLSKLSERGESMSLELCLSVAAQTARGLHAAHELAGPSGESLALVHRDVSPHNILLDFAGVVRVSDFGIAKALGNLTLTSTGILKGNVGYMSPEYLRFEPVDRRADLYSLGVVLYELLTGARLHPGADAHATARLIIHQTLPDPIELRRDIPPDVVELLTSLLAKRPELRPRTAAEVADRLDHMLHDEEPADLREFLRERFAAEHQQQTDRVRSLERTTALSGVESDVAWSWASIRTGWLRLAVPIATAAAIVGGTGAAALHWNRAPAQGLRGEYFIDRNLQSRRLVRNDPNIYFDWGFSSPHTSLPKENYSVRWTGHLLPSFSRSSQLCLRSDDGVRLWLDGAFLIDDWTLHTPRQRCAAVVLREGDRRSLRVEYFQYNNEAIVELRWEPGSSTGLVAISPQNFTLP